MLVIRLQRTGRAKAPLYRLVLAEKRTHVSKKVVEILGHYNPRTKALVTNQDLLDKWLALKVECSDSAHNLLLRNKLLTGTPRIPNFSSKKKTKASASK